jgi:hypothetical protein
MFPVAQPVNTNFQRTIYTETRAGSGGHPKEVRFPDVVTAGIFLVQLNPLLKK